MYKSSQPPQKNKKQIFVTYFIYIILALWDSRHLETVILHLCGICQFHNLLVSVTVLPQVGNRFPFLASRAVSSTILSARYDEFRVSGFSLHLCLCVCVFSLNAWIATDSEQLDH